MNRRTSPASSWGCTAMLPLLRGPDDRLSRVQSAAMHKRENLFCRFSLKDRTGQGWTGLGRLYGPYTESVQTPYRLFRA